MKMRPFQETRTLGQKRYVQLGLIEVQGRSDDLAPIGGACEAPRHYLLPVRRVRAKNEAEFLPLQLASLVLESCCPDVVENISNAMGDANEVCIVAG